MTDRRTLDPRSHAETLSVLDLVHGERRRQDQKYGSQRHLRPEQWLAVLGREYCEAGNEANEHYKGRAKDGGVRLREELIQVAAVCVAWVEALDAAEAERADERDSNGLSHADRIAPAGGLAPADPFALCAGDERAAPDPRNIIMPCDKCGQNCLGFDCPERTL